MIRRILFVLSMAVAILMEVFFNAFSPFSVLVIVHTSMVSTPDYLKKLPIFAIFTIIADLWYGTWVGATFASMVLSFATLYILNKLVHSDEWPATFAKLILTFTVYHVAIASFVGYDWAGAGISGLLVIFGKLLLVASVESIVYILIYQIGNQFGGHKSTLKLRP